MLIGTDDNYIRALKGEEIFFEFTEASKTRNIISLSPTLYALEFEVLK